MRISAHFILERILRVVLRQRNSEAELLSITRAHLMSLVLPQMHIGMLPYAHPAVAALVWELKYHAHPRALRIASAVLEERMLGLCEEALGTPLLVYIPADPKRVKTRGHNHLALVCEAIAARMGNAIAYMPLALYKTRHTPPQQTLPRTKRLRNVHASMEAAAWVKGHTCILLDDVTTTGATLSEGRRALLEAGAADVVSMALAQA